MNDDGLTATENENKMTDEEMYHAGPVSFAELDEINAAAEMRHRFASLADEFLGLASNILHSDQIADKAGAVADLSQEFTERLASLDIEKAIKAVWSTAYVNTLPDSAFLYIESGGEKDGDGKTVPRSLRHFPVKDDSGKPDPAHLRNAIAQASKAKDKDGKPLSDAIVKRVQNSAREMLAKTKEDAGFFKTVLRKAKEVLAPKRVDSPFFVWKEADTGKYWWLAIYSNNFKDNDRPPEIISAAAHQEFVKAVDGGVWPMPELWLWHVPGTKCGKAHLVDFDKETGFAVAAGTFDDDKSATAEALMKMDGLLVSHGMPSAFIKRDLDDKSVIVDYRTREISPLPDWAAANKATGFVILNKEQQKMISEEKTKFLADLGLDVEKLDAALKDAAETLQNAGVPSKEVNAELGEATEVKAEVEPAAEDPEPEQVPDNTLTQQAVAAAVVAGVNLAMEQISGQLKEISDRIEALEKSEAAIDAMTPAASFAQMIKSAVIGDNSTKVDGRTKEAKDGPAEADPVIEGEGPFDVVNMIKSGGDWRKALSR